MISLKKTGLVLTFVCVLLLIANILVWKPAAQETENCSQQVFQITNTSVSDVLALTVKNQNGSFAVMQQGDELEVISEYSNNIEYDFAQLHALIYTVSHLSGSEKNSDEKTFQNYNFNSPVAEITILTKQGEQKLSVLMENPMDRNYYLYSKEQNAIYLVGKEEAKLMLRSEKDFTSHTVLPTVSSESLENVKSISFDFGDNKYENFRIIKRDGSFYLTNPFETRLSTSEVYSRIFAKTNALYADEILSEEEAAAYNATEYTLKITIITTAGESTVLLKDLADGSYLMQNENGGRVCRLKDDSLANLMLKPIDLLDGKIFSFNVGDIKSIKTYGDDVELLLNCTRESADGKVTINGKEKEVHLFAEDWKTFCLNIGSVKIQKQVTAIKQNTMKMAPLLTMKIGDNHDEINELGFYEENGEIKVFFNGICNFVCSQDTFNRISNAFFNI